ncbi:MAG: hypothetical protein ABEJ40_06005 [Haloarculaceae archaeon]
MHRRAVLRALPVAAAGAAGCLGLQSGGTDVRTRTDGDRQESRDADDGDRTADHPDDPTTDDPDDGSGVVEFDPGDGEPVATVRVGDGTEREGVRPHAVVVWNEGPERDVTASVRAASGSPSVERPLTLARGEYVLFELTERVDYRVTVRIGDGTTHEFRVPESFVDCNHSRTTVRIPAEGPIEHSTLSTTMLCRTLTVDGPDQTVPGT